jgi:hypothetical protein
MEVLTELDYRFLQAFQSLAMVILSTTSAISSSLLNKSSKS